MSVEVDGDLSALPQEVASTAYRIAAEALTNVARHSGASTCHVELRLDHDRLEVHVCDDGQGMAGAQHTGVGVESMRRRAAAVGGRFTIGPSHPSGTDVLAILPLGTGVA